MINRKMIDEKLESKLIVFDKDYPIDIENEITFLLYAFLSRIEEGYCFLKTTRKHQDTIDFFRKNGFIVVSDGDTCIFIYEKEKPSNC